MCPVQGHRKEDFPRSGNDGRSGLRSDRIVHGFYQNGATIGELYREERWEYPLEAIREALVNAVIHRDYIILGSDVKVAIYDDMLEITSPGPLPDALSIEDLGSGRSEIRNRVLAPIFKDLKLIEAWGSGIQKMQQELRDYPEIELILRESGHAFQVQFVKKGLRKN